MAIRLLVTGGTFDKEYDEIRGTLFFRDSHLEQMLAMGRCRLDVRVDQLMLVDSLEMTDQHRDRIAKACSTCAEDRVVITHGTDTMTDTAKRLATEGLAKTIVLTGAMIPIAFGSSDGLFNLGSALSLSQVLPAGVYIAMNGRVFDWDKVQKNRETGVFEAV
ncbi:MAG: asparaginase domain-containing protein [Longimicrobiales bacterium]